MRNSSQSKTKKLIVIILVFIVFAGNLPADYVDADSRSFEGTEYYISNKNGNDNNSGTSAVSPWKTLDKVNSMTFQSGDKILFDNQSSWVGQLAPKGSGTKGSPIIIDRYGDGDRKPIIQGNGLIDGEDTKPDLKKYNAAVFFYNQQYWEIKNLEVTNYSEQKSTYQTYDSSSNIITKKDTIPSKYGILIMAQDAGTLSHMYVQNCNIYDVNADPIDNRGAGIGRGGIIYIIRGNTIATQWDDIIVEGNKVGPRITHYGINFLSTWAGAIFPHESGVSGKNLPSEKAYSKNIIIRNNYCVDVGNAAISPSGYENVVIENNVSDVCNSGTNGNVPIWWQIGKSTTVQYNEVFGTGASTSKEDSQAFDGDLLAAENIVQYNYTHDNPSGSYFECALGTVYTTHYRYNISRNDGSGTNSHGGGAVITVGGGSNHPGSKLYVYNNDMYIGKGQFGHIANSWDTDLRPENFIFNNNLMYNSGISKGWEAKFLAGSTVDNNFYGGSGLNALKREDDLNAVYETKGKKLNIPNLDDLLMKSMEDSTGYDQIELFKRDTNSILHQTGKNIQENGGLDIYGNPVSPFGNPSVGAHETAPGFQLPDDAVLLDFESGLPVQPEDGESVYLKNLTYKGVKFNNLDYKAEKTPSNGTEFYANNSSSGFTTKLTIPKGYSLYGFSARTKNSAIVTLEAEDTNKKFYITSAKNFYETKYEEPSDGKQTVSITISSPWGANQVKFDNLILVKQDEHILRNVALNKTATQNRGLNVAGLAVDGNVSTMAGNTGTYPYIWQLDLGELYYIEALEIEWEDLYTGENKQGENIPENWKYKIEGSADNSVWQTIIDYSNDNPHNDPANSMVQRVEELKLEVQYFKVTITEKPDQKSDAWAVIPEFRAFGRKLSETYKNIALNKTAEQSGGLNSASLGNDGNINTFAGNVGTFNLDKPYQWQVDLNNLYRIARVEIEWEDLWTGAGKTGENIAEDWKYKIEYSADNINWTVITDYTESSPHTDPETSALQFKDVDIETRHLRISVVGRPSKRPSAWAIVPEFRAFGTPVEKGEPGGTIDLSNLAYGKPIITNSANKEHLEAVTDGLHETSWTSAADETWLQIDLGRVYDINAAELYFKGEKAHKFKMAASENGSVWREYLNYETNEKIGEVIEDYDSTVAARYLKLELPKAETEIALLKFYGELAKTESKSILIMAPHPDDEALLGGGIIRTALDRGDKVKVLIATLGDFNGMESGKNRMKETISAMNYLGLATEDIIFLTYPDNGGLEQFGQNFTDSALYQMYIAEDENKVIPSRNGHTQTYGGVVDDYHYLITGEHGQYTRKNIMFDIHTVIDTLRPNEIYTTSRFDLHADHAFIGFLSNEAIIKIKKQERDYNPVVYEALIHSCEGDATWPVVNQDSKGLTLTTMPKDLETKTTLDWNKRVSITVPELMKVTPFINNLKTNTLKKYTSQYYDYIGAFAKFDEVFWTRDYSGISFFAEVTASSEKSSSNPKDDSSAQKVIDGIADGESNSMLASSGGKYTNLRFPFAEWVTHGERVGAWVRLTWENSYLVNKVVLFDRPNEKDHIISGTLKFSDGSNVEVTGIPNDGRPLEIHFESRAVDWVEFVVNEVSNETENIGLSEFEVFGSQL